MSFISLILRFKHGYPALWGYVSFLNGFAVSLLYRKRLIHNAVTILKSKTYEPFEYRLLGAQDYESLCQFFETQNADQFKYFKPHAFDPVSLFKIVRDSTYVLFGVFDNQKLVGYFFLRCFLNKKCFTGRLVALEYQGKGISKVMGIILLNTAWKSGFRVFGTASKENIKSLNSYKAINKYKIRNELSNNFIHFEYIKEKDN